MIVADLPPLEQERIVCSISASVAYGVPADIMLAIAEIEGGTPDTKSVNQNKSNDYGYMQFNSAYLSDLSKKYGEDFEQLASSEGCYSFFLAAWRVGNHLKHDSGTVWQRAANYHSRTEKYNLIYQRKLINKARQWANWLNLNYSLVKWSKK